MTDLMHTDRLSTAEIVSPTRAHRFPNHDAHAARGGAFGTRHIGPVGDSNNYVMPDGTMMAAEMDPSALTVAQLERMADEMLRQDDPGRDWKVGGYRFDAKAEVFDSVQEVSPGHWGAVDPSFGAYRNSTLADGIDAETAAYVAARERDGSIGRNSPEDVACAILSERQRNYGKAGRVAKFPAARKAMNGRRGGDARSATEWRFVVDSDGTAVQTHCAMLAVHVGERTAIGHVWQDRTESRDARDQRIARENLAERQRSTVLADVATDPIADCMARLERDGKAILTTRNGSLRVTLSPSSGRFNVTTTIDALPPRRQYRDTGKVRTALLEALDA